MLENINLAFQGVWSHKLRSFLTMLGIIIGIAAIITIVSTIQGTNEQIKQNLIGAGNNVVNVTLMQDNNQMDFSYNAVPDGIAMITADHGCDPSYTKTTDHTREYVPYLVCGKGVKAGMDLGTKLCFGTIAKTICEYLEVDASTLDGKSVWQEIRA